MKVKTTDDILTFNTGSASIDDLNLLDFSDCTAFEVYPHENILSGESTELNGTITNEIPASMTHKFFIKSYSNAENNDIIIDWGDSSTSTIANNEFDSVTESYIYEVSHTYVSTGKYIVKIYGKDYYGLAGAETYSTVDETTGLPTEYNNLICRIFDEDLPVASNLIDFSDFCNHALMLLNVDMKQSRIKSKISS